MYAWECSLFWILLSSRSIAHSCQISRDSSRYFKLSCAGCVLVEEIVPVTQLSHIQEFEKVLYSLATKRISKLDFCADTATIIH